jgi:serine/threonine protein kinase
MTMRSINRIVNSLLYSTSTMMIEDGHGHAPTTGTGTGTSSSSSSSPLKIRRRNVPKNGEPQSPPALLHNHRATKHTGRPRKALRKIWCRLVWLTGQRCFFVMCGVLACGLTVYKHQTHQVRRKLLSSGMQSSPKVSFLSHSAFTRSTGTRTPANFRPGEFFGPAGTDFGDIHFDTIQYMPDHWYRLIDTDADYYEDRFKSRLLEDEDGFLQPEFEHFEDLDFPQPGCQRLKWGDDSHSTCNRFHELPLDYTDDYSKKYLAHGFYRDTWLFESKSPLLENLVLKRLRLNEDHDYSWWTAKHIYREALIMERTTSSQHTIDIYGHCYTSVLVEPAFELSKYIVEGVEYKGRGRISQAALDEMQVEDVYPFNNFTTEEKLDIALGMAQGIAVLHGNAEGVVVNDDVHPDQFLINKDGLVKFNDFNNARLLEWNATANNYCKFDTWIGGDYRSPEEMNSQDIDEKSDIWPLGANIFVLLSGLYPYYTVWETKAVEHIVSEGIKPILDERYKTRSLIEGRLYEIMEQCWEIDPEQRVSIFDVVKHLQETKVMVEQAKLEGTFRKEEPLQQKSLLQVRQRYIELHGEEHEEEEDSNDHDHEHLWLQYKHHEHDDEEHENGRERREHEEHDAREHEDEHEQLHHHNEEEASNSRDDANHDHYDLQEHLEHEQEHEEQEHEEQELEEQELEEQELEEQEHEEQESSTEGDDEPGNSL